MCPGARSVASSISGAPGSRRNLSSRYFCDEQVAIDLGLHARDASVDTGVGHDAVDELEVAVDRGVVSATTARADDQRDAEPARAEQPEPEVALVRGHRPDPLTGAEIERATVGGAGVDADELDRSGETGLE